MFKERQSPRVCSERTLLWTGRGWVGTLGAEGRSPDALLGLLPVKGEDQTADETKWNKTRRIPD